MSKKKYKIVTHMGIAFSTLGGQKYLFPGWIPVEDHISFDDVEVINPYAHIKRETFKVIGSTGNKYTVTKRGDKLSCDCPAGRFRGYCKHIKQIEEQLATA